MKIIKKIIIIATGLLIFASPSFGVTISDAQKKAFSSAAKSWQKIREDRQTARLQSIKTKCPTMNEAAKAKSLMDDVRTENIAAVEAWIDCGANPHIGISRFKEPTETPADYLDKWKKDSKNYQALYNALHKRDKK